METGFVEGKLSINKRYDYVKSFLVIICYIDNIPVFGMEVSLHAFKAQELDVEKELTSLIAKVQKGHLIELQEICGDWGPLD